MKQLACEMCGGTDLIKQDGVFVCQSCGMKYSIEDAKKMMIEGTVEIQGSVKVENAVKIENLLDLAHNSFNSKNYAQAEEFCNQAIAIDAANYDAWKLKGESINYQISVNNQRILEVYNCIMTSFKVLDDASKEEHRDEIMDSLRTCLEGEIDFWLEQFKNGRPTNTMLEKVEKAFTTCVSRIVSSFSELGYSDEESEKYEDYIRKHFVEKANEICESVWDTTVAYNYYGENGFYTDSVYRGRDEYRPNEETMTTFISETDNLRDLLRFTENYFENSPDELKLKIYNNIILYQQKASGAVSFKLVVTDKTTSWETDKTLTSEAISIRNKNIAEYKEKALNLNIKMAKESPEKKEELINDYKEKIDAIDPNAKPEPSKVFLFLTIFSWLLAVLIPVVTDIGFKGSITAVVICGFMGAVFLITANSLYNEDKEVIMNLLAERKRLEDELDKIMGYINEKSGD